MGRCHGSDSWYRYVCALEALLSPPILHAWTAPAEGWGKRTRRFLDNGGKALVIGDELMAWLKSAQISPAAKFLSESGPQESCKDAHEDLPCLPGCLPRR